MCTPACLFDIVQKKTILDFLIAVSVIGTRSPVPKLGQLVKKNQFSLLSNSVLRVNLIKKGYIHLKGIQHNVSSPKERGTYWFQWNVSVCIQHIS